jgi:hypothetical protein
MAFHNGGVILEVCLYWECEPSLPQLHVCLLQDPATIGERA